MKKEPQNIGIVTFPIGEANVPPLSNFVHICQSISQNTYVITGNAGATLFQDYHNNFCVSTINYKIGTNVFTRIVNYARTQLKISYKLARLSRSVDVWLFPIGAEKLLPAMLVAKLLRKHSILALTSSAVEIQESQKDSLGKVTVWFAKANYYLADRIILYSPNLIHEWNLEKYGHKISIAHEHFLDFGKFKIEKPLDERSNLVGYVGRLSGEKGILNFLEAIPKVLETRDEVAFLIGGDGQLRPQVEECVDKLDGKVQFVGWIPHDELPKYLNELKLLVLPSYTEGLPNIMLEAMACGTPVLATPVGAIPDIIKDGETGFIMENNSPECIAQNIIRALKHPDLEQIARNARALVEREFTFKKVVERYREILNYKG